MSAPVLEEYRCTGQRKNGRRCTYLFFKGVIRQAVIEAKCPTCNAMNRWSYLVEPAGR